LNFLQFASSHKITAADRHQASQIISHYTNTRKMYTGKEKLPKLKAALCTIGGIVVGTNALRTLIAMNNVAYSDEFRLRGAKLRNEINPIARNITDTDDRIPKRLYEWAYQAEKDQSQTETVGYLSLFKNSNTSNDGTLPSKSVMKERVLAEATETSTLFGSDPEPSDTTGLFTVSSSFKTTEIEHKDGSFSPRSNFENGFRLRLYWHEDYFWQERTHERWWCMSCGQDGECKENENMYLRKCNPKTSLDAIFKVIKQKKGHQLQVVGTDLCLQKRGKSRQILLKPCRNTPLQRFFGFKFEEEKFELRPSRFADKCLSNHHHPKDGELVYSENCSLAHKADTGYWVAY